MIFKHFFLVSLLFVSNGEQLPSGLSIYQYALHLIFTEETFTSSPYEFKGELEIRFSLTGSYPTDVKLHASNDFIRIDSAGLEVFNTSLVELTDFEIDDEDVLTLGGTQIANTTLYTSVLYINYTSRLSTDDLYGLYRADYTKNGANQYLVASQLEPTFARRVLPCIDEVTGKTYFKLNVTHPSNVEVFFNSAANFTEVGVTEATTYFFTTGSMAPYMMGLTFAILDNLECTVGQNFTYGTVYYYRVCSSPESADSRQWALEVGPTIMDTLYNITNFGYGVAMGFQKMDVMALPILGTDASENWGIVTFREENILYNSDDSDSLNKQTITETMAYEFAQMWYGNVASPELWNYLYLTKGLAYYLQFLVIEQIFPDWGVTSQFSFRILQPALQLDALETAPNLRTGANDTAEIIGKFDTFNLIKSASLYRMLTDVIAGYPSFRRGIEYFLTSFSYRNSQPQGLWNLISAQINLDNRDRLPSGVYLKDVLLAWETNPGYPLLTVSTEDGMLKINQEGRFLYTGADKSYSWYVPVTYIFSSNITGFDNTTVSQYVLPDGDGLEVPLPTEEEDWIVVNIQATGYYRVHYGVLWSNLSSALKQSQFSEIPELNRAQLIDDAFELARANYLNYSVAFDLLAYIAEEESLSPWMTALNKINYVLRRVGYASTLGLKISTLVLTDLSKIYSSVSWSVVDDEDQAYSVKQMMILEFACKLKYMDCVKNAKSLFTSFANSGTKPHKNLRRTVYCTGLMFGGDTSYWDTLVAAYGSTDVAVEKLRILQVLGCSENENLLRKSLDFSLDENVKPQDAHVILESVFQSSNLGAKLALEFLVSNYKTMVQRYQSMNALRQVVLGLAEHLEDSEDLTSFKNFLQTTSDLPEEIQLVADQAVEIAEINKLWLNDHQNELKEYFNIGN